MKFTSDEITAIAWRVQAEGTRQNNEVIAKFRSKNSNWEKAKAVWTIMRQLPPDFRFYVNTRIRSIDQVRDVLAKEGVKSKKLRSVSDLRTEVKMKLESKQYANVSELVKSINPFV